MPWHVGESSECPVSKPYAVIKDSDGSVVGCHPTKAAANDQLAALYANESKSQQNPTSSERGTGMTTSLALRKEMGGPEHRVTTNGSLSLREKAGGDGPAMANLLGFASVTEVSYKMQDWLGEYDEIVRSGSFVKTIAEADVRLLLNHEGLPLARTKSGTLRLREIMDGKDDPQGRGQTGLWVDADLDPESGLVRDIKSAMSRGDLDQMSFGFQVVRQKWSPDYTQRDIEEVRLFDVSVVTYPANDSTSASIRSLDAILAHLTDDQAREAHQRLTERLDRDAGAGVAFGVSDVDYLLSRP